MSHILSALTAAAGLAIFLFAMARLTDTVRRNVTNTRTRELFRHAVRTPILGVATGLVITILFQSSTATTVLAVGLVSAGLMSFYHSLGVILGADIGTTLTVQLVVWRVTDLSPAFVVGGALLWVLGRRAWRHFGEGIFYFGLMFYGLNIVTRITESFKGSPLILQFFSETAGPLTGILIGCGLTALVHSSAIPIALLVILAGHGLLSLDAALPFVLGANLGTAATAMIAAAAANIEGRRVAVSHALFKFAGVVLCMALFSPMVSLLESLSSSVPQQISLGHIVFNLLVAAVFLPVLPLYARFALWLMPEQQRALSLWPEYLDDRLMGNPEAALEAVRKEMEREMKLARKMCLRSMDLVDDFQGGKMSDVMLMEDVVNALEREIGAYLRRVSEGSLSQLMSRELFYYSALVSDIERVADHAVNLSELAALKKEKEIPFTEAAHRDIAGIRELVEANLNDALELLGGATGKAIENIFTREKQIDRLFAEAKIGHLDRYSRKICRAEAGPIFMGILVNMERISDHCENMAEYFMEIRGIGKES